MRFTCPQMEHVPRRELDRAIFEIDKAAPFETLQHGMPGRHIPRMLQPGMQHDARHFESVAAEECFTLRTGQPGPHWSDGKELPDLQIRVRGSDHGWVLRRKLDLTMLLG